VDESADGIWIGTTKRLLALLLEKSRESGQDEHKDKSWPRTTQKLGRILRRLAVALLSEGIRYTEPDRRTKSRELQLQRVGGRTAPKAPKGTSLNQEDLDGADVGADRSDSVPIQFHTNGTTQPIETTDTYKNGSYGAVLPPVSLKQDMPRPRVHSTPPKKSYRCPGCGRFRTTESGMREHLTLCVRFDIGAMRLVRSRLREGKNVADDLLARYRKYEALGLGALDVE